MAQKAHTVTSAIADRSERFPHSAAPPFFSFFFRFLLSFFFFLHLLFPFVPLFNTFSRVFFSRSSSCVFPLLFLSFFHSFVVSFFLTFFPFFSLFFFTLVFDIFSFFIFFVLIIIIIIDFFHFFIFFIFWALLGPSSRAFPKTLLFLLFPTRILILRHDTG